MVIEFTLLALTGWFALPIILRKTVFRPAQCTSRRKLTGMVAIVTGSNTGLGYETALDIAKRGAKVYLACRDVQKAEEARNRILRQCPDAQLVVDKLDLSSLTSVKIFTDEFLKKENQLDILIANAGFGSTQHKLTEDNIEWHLATNHLGHFYMIRLLFPLLQKSGASDSKSRIVILSSRAHKYFVNRIDYDGLQRGDYFNRNLAYGQSKLANLLCMRYLSKLLEGKNVTVNAVHPGTVNSEFFRHYLPFPNVVARILGVIMFPVSHMTFTSVEGAQTQIYAAVDEALEGVTGKYLDNCSIIKPSKYAEDDEEAEKLWRWSCSKTKLPLNL